MRPETLAVKAIEIAEATGAVVPPIHLSTTYARDADYQLIAGRDYTRDKNPTPLGVERALAALEAAPTRSCSRRAWPRRRRSCARR
jgi:cystathionine gamma-synthase